jgi:hypothetical protein
VPNIDNKIRQTSYGVARAEDREFASITKRWDIDWFWKVDATGPERDPLHNRKEFYALNLIDADTEQQLWAYL